MKYFVYLNEHDFLYLFLQKVINDIMFFNLDMKTEVFEDFNNFLDLLLKVNDDAFITYTVSYNMIMHIYSVYYRIFLMIMIYLKFCFYFRQGGNAAQFLEMKLSLLKLSIDRYEKRIY
jgi:hypothetical protein